MKVLIQRVTQAQVTVAGASIGAIGNGLLLLVGIEKSDTHSVLQRMAKKILHYRLFTDIDGKMNLNLHETGGELLVVSQFTLAADTNKGLRPSFSAAAPPEMARDLYHQFVAILKTDCNSVKTGSFGANMQISLTNDGPVTFMFEM